MTTHLNSNFTVVQSPSEWFAGVADVLGRQRLKWARAGALAANEYRLASRLTIDADATAQWSDDLPEQLEAAGYSVKAMADLGEHPHLLIVRHGEERTDLLIPTVEYQELALERGDANNHCLTIEDVIVHKLIAWRPKDKEDVASILARALPRDDDYIARWAYEWEVTQRWEAAKRGDYGTD
jgi:hypothetical protein